MREQVVFDRECEAIKIPEGETVEISEGEEGHLVQFRSGNATVRIPSKLWQVQVKPENIDALVTPDGDEIDVDIDEDVAEMDGVPEDMESAVYEKLSECYDPEIPVNIVDLGLIYGVDIAENGTEDYSIDVNMTLTAQGCGMGEYLAQDAEEKIHSIPGVTDVEVEIVWDPQWNENMMTEEAQEKLGFT